jgi:hypothetical protein
MSAIDYSNMTPEQLLTQRTLIDTEIANRGASGSGGKQNKEKKEQKPKRRSQGTAWAAFGKKVTEDHPTDYEAFKASAEKKQGIMPLFASQYRSKHEAEWLAFQASWNETHPKLAPLPKEKKCELVSSAEQSETEEVESKVESKDAEKPEGKRRGPKKLSEMTAEELATHNAKKEAKAKERKAKKEAEAVTSLTAAVAEAPVAPVPVPAPVTVAPVVTTTTVAQKDDEVAEFRVFKMDSQDYLRIFNKDDNDWASVDLWYTNKDGKRGRYFGELMEDGSVNTDAEEPELE